MARKMILGVMLIWTGLVMITAGFMIGTPALAGAAGEDWQAQVIRLHVLANSDSDEDQALKRAVRDAMLAEISPAFSEATTPAEARKIIARAIPRIEQIAAEVVTAAGKSYAIRAEMGRFSFPGKAYGMLYLPAGEYTALRITIGEAEGANWWCILFPPMCFVDWSTGFVLEPKESTGGAETVKVPRRELLTLVDEQELASMPVKARFALLDWLKGKDSKR